MAGKALCPPLLLCSKCKECAYCDRECQKRSWRAGHKKKCGTVVPAAPVASREATAQAKKALHDALLARTKKSGNTSRKAEHTHSSSDSSSRSPEGSDEWETEEEELHEDVTRHCSRKDLVESSDSPLTAKQKRVLRSLYTYAELVQQTGLGSDGRAQEIRDLAKREGEFCALAAAMQDCDNLHIAAMIYEELGKIQEKIREYIKAVEFFEKSKTIQAKATPPDMVLLMMKCYYLGTQLRCRPRSLLKFPSLMKDLR